MDRIATEAAIKALLHEIRHRIEGIANTARVAEACAEAGNVDAAITVLLDIEQPTYEATRLFDAASLLNRISKED